MVKIILPAVYIDKNVSFTDYFVYTKVQIKFANNYFTAEGMKITLLLSGKTEDEYLTKGITKYTGRLVHYIPFEIIVVPSLKNSKNLAIEQQKQKESEAFIKSIPAAGYVVLLDEHGKEFTSVAFSEFLQKQINSGVRNLYFIIGGPYGFSNEILQRADQLLSLSQMTFSHQMVRLLFVEQLYRAFTILKNESYHHF